ncbi:MAG: SPOR domain-containing protein [Xanthobacteraceae bacterium]
MAERYQYRQDATARDTYSDYPSERRQIENDPLAELARLIGQTDPQSAFGRANLRPEPSEQYQPQDYEQPAPAPATPAWMRTAQETNWQQQPPPADEYHQAPPAYHDVPAYDEPARADYGHAPVEPPAFLRTARQHAAPEQRYDEVLYDQNAQNAQYADQYYQDRQGGYADDQYQQGGYAQYETEDEPQRRRGGMTTVVAVLALAVVGTGAAFAYRQFVGSPRSGEPPIIRADTGATKVVPPTQVSDAGKIVDRVGTPGQERMIPREEQPVDLSRNAPRVVFPNVTATTPASGTPTQPQQTAAVGGVTATQPSTALGDEPRRVRTLSIRSDQPDTAPSQTAATAPAPSRAVASARAQAPANGGPMSLSPQAASAPQRTAAVHTSGGYVVQVSSQRSEADAQAAYRAIQSRFPNVLGSRSAMIRRADLGERGIYYRAMVGPFSAAEEAGQLCNSLKSVGGQCVVQRN